MSEINVVSSGILKGSPVVISENLNIFIYFSETNEHFEISKINCKSLKITKSTEKHTVLEILWITEDISEITVDKCHFNTVKNILEESF